MFALPRSTSPQVAAVELVGRHQPLLAGGHALLLVIGDEAKLDVVVGLQEIGQHGLDHQRARDVNRIRPLDPALTGDSIGELANLLKLVGIGKDLDNGSGAAEFRLERIDDIGPLPHRKVTGSSRDTCDGLDAREPACHEDEFR